MVFDRSICCLPQETFLEEKVLRCKGDVIISDRSEVERTLITEGRTFLGERVHMKGDIVSLGDIRIDRETHVQGNITGDADIFIGEKSIIAGQLVVGRSLDIGEDVKIDPNAIDSRGHINIRNPISVIVYIFLYLLELFKRDDPKEVEGFIHELESGREEDFLISRNFTYFPKGSRIETEGMFIPGDLKVGPNSQLVANVEAMGRIDIERGVQVFGELRAREGIYIGEDAVINGDIHSEGDVDIYHSARIAGDIKACKVSITSDTLMEGFLKGEEGIRIITDRSQWIEEHASELVNEMDELLGELE